MTVHRRTCIDKHSVIVLPVIIWSHERIEATHTRQVDVVLQDDHIAHLVGVVDASCSISGYESLNSQRLHHSDWEHELQCDTCLYNANI